MAHGHIYPAEQIDAALGNYFRDGNLTALRELALLWVADRVDEGWTATAAEHGIDGDLGGPGADRRRAHRRPRGRDAAAPRRPDRRPGAGSDLLAVHVVRVRRRLTGADAAEIERQRLLAESARRHLPHRRRRRHRRDAVLEFARGVNATQIIVGASRHGRLAAAVPARASAIAIVRGSG